MGSERLHVVLKLGKYIEDGEDEPVIWGIVLADIARHVARGLANQYELDELVVLSALRERLTAELDQPTSQLRSELPGRGSGSVD
jgi:hypothetical protein